MKEQYKKIGSDESYTYPSLILPLIPHIWAFARRFGRTPIIWCPFSFSEDKNINGHQFYRSYYVDIFKKEGFRVISSHLHEGKDFFEYEPDRYDLIIDNPPFQNKKAFFERAISLNKPFCLLAPIIWLNDGTPNKLFADNSLQLLIPDKRSNFFNTRGENLKNSGQISFKSAYFCRYFLEKDLIFFELDKSAECFSYTPTLF